MCIRDRYNSSVENVKFIYNLWQNKLTRKKNKSNLKAKGLKLWNKYFFRGVSILKRDGDELSASGTYKGTCKVKVPLDYLLHYCHTIEYRNEFDTLFEAGMYINKTITFSLSDLNVSLTAYILNRLGWALPLNYVHTLWIPPPLKLSFHIFFFEFWIHNTFSFNCI